jgi:hypothetical protein
MRRQAEKRAVRFSHASSEDNIREAARRFGVVFGEVVDRRQALLGWNVMAPEVTE